VDEGPSWTPPAHAKARQALRQAGSAAAETALKKAGRFRGASEASVPPAPWILWGPLIVSFDQGDVRLTPNGVLVYGAEEVREIAVSDETDGRDGIINQFYDAVTTGKRPANDGRWGKATLEVLLALFQSGNERQEILLSHQVATLD
jgi:phthalate 4,5-cis-dihydrodiol dehydrogenase